LAVDDKMVLEKIVKLTSQLAKWRVDEMVIDKMAVDEKKVG